MKTSLKTQNARIANAMLTKSLSAKSVNGKSAPTKPGTTKPKTKPVAQLAAPKSETKKRMVRKSNSDKSVASVPVPQAEEPIVETAVTAPEPVAQVAAVEPIIPTPDTTAKVAQQIVLRAGALKAAIKNVERARGKSSLPVLSHILIESIDTDALRLTATDLNFALWHFVQAKVLQHGSVCVPELLGNLLSKVNDDLLVTLTTDAKTWTTKIEAGRLTTHLKSLDPIEFPPATQFNGNSVYLGADLTHEAVSEIAKRVAPFAASDDSRPVLQGVYVTGARPKESGKNTTLTFVAADGFRLAVLEREATLHFDPAAKMPDTWGINVPARVFAETLKMATDDAKPIQFLFHLQYDKKGALERGMVQVETHAGGMRMNLIDGPFPDFTQIVPNPIPPLPTMPLAVDATLAALGRASLISPVNAAHLQVQPDHIRITATNTDTGDLCEIVPAEFDPMSAPAPKFEIAFNAVLLGEAIRAAAYGDGIKPVKLLVNTSGGPGYINLPRYRHVLMPMNVSGGSAAASPKPAATSETARPDKFETGEKAPQPKAPAEKPKIGKQAPKATKAKATNKSK